MNPSLPPCSLALTVARDADGVGEWVADQILGRLAATDPGRSFYLAGPAGRTPTTTYAASAASPRLAGSTCPGWWW